MRLPADYEHIFSPENQCGGPALPEWVMSVDAMPPLSRSAMPLLTAVVADISYQQLRAKRRHGSFHLLKDDAVGTMAMTTIVVENRHQPKNTARRPHPPAPLRNVPSPRRQWARNQW
jgi:hypothetical protein